MGDRRFRIAVCQIRISHDPEANLAKIVQTLNEAKSGGAEIALLPECAVSGYPAHRDGKPSPIPISEIESVNSRLPDTARQIGIACVVGTITRQGRRLRNSALAIDEQGNLLARADKLHMFEDDGAYFEPGHDISTFTWHGALMGVLICYDIRFPEPFRILKQMGAEMVFVPLNARGADTWKIPVLEAAFRTRAAENAYWLAAANAAGPRQMCVSRVCDPDGLSPAAAEVDEEQIIYADINLDHPAGRIYADRRTDLFEVRMIRKRT